MSNQLDRIESKLDRLLGEVTPKAAEEHGLEYGDYIEASREVVDELDRLGFEWYDKDRTKHPRIGFLTSMNKLLNGNLADYYTHRPDFLARARVTAKKLGLIPKEAPKPTTIKGWLETLPEPYRTQALGVMWPEVSHRACSALSSAIFDMCNWHSTTQGGVYWIPVYEWAKDPANNQLPDPWVAPAKEPCVPKVGEWVVFHDGTWQANIVKGAIRVASGPDGDSHWKTDPCEMYKGGFFFSAFMARPATPEEIATKEREDKLSKLVFGAKVMTPRGEGMYHYNDVYNHWVVFPKGEVENFHPDDITPL